ncbi:SRPBCC family protein [Sphingobacterium faecium]
MPKIEITTEINAPIELCFDLARSIDLHKISALNTHEKAIDGKTEGLIGLNEYVTWQATHFGIKQKLTSRISTFERPYYFVDEQVKGIFKSLYHEHIFEQVGDQVIMKDIFDFQSPLGICGRLFNRFVLTDYLKKFLITRNHTIKEFAETDRWKELDW